jgi:hypothetical protein
MIKPQASFNAARLANEDLSSSALGTLVDLAPTFEMLVGHRGHGEFTHVITSSIPYLGYERLKALLRHDVQLPRRGAR